MSVDWQKLNVYIDNKVKLNWLTNEETVLLYMYNMLVRYEAFGTRYSC